MVFPKIMELDVQNVPDEALISAGLMNQQEFIKWS